MDPSESILSEVIHDILIVILYADWGFPVFFLSPKFFRPRTPQSLIYEININIINSPKGE
jgi:hypothetical protein